MSVEITKLDEIETAPGRLRRAFDETKLRELAEDIRRNGLYHPPVIAPMPEEAKSSARYRLVAGERRLRAIKILAESNTSFKCDERTINPGRCPYIQLNSFDPAQILEIELHENILRIDLDWKDIQRARAKLHEYLQTQRTDGKEQTFKETGEKMAEIVGNNAPKTMEILTSQAVVITKKLDEGDERLKHARSQQEAWRIIRQDYEATFKKALLERADQTQIQHTLILGDIFQKRVKDKAFDLTIIDPPYGISAEKFGDAAQATHTYSDDPEASFAANLVLLERAAAWSKDEAHLFMFCDIEWFTALRDGADSRGWTPFRTPLIWHKPTGGHIPWGTYQPRRTTELILYCLKGRKDLKQLQIDLLTFASDRELSHGAQKPVALYARLMELCGSPGDSVIDPMCGSGVVFRAANRERWVATGVELNPETHKLASASLYEGLRE